MLRLRKFMFDRVYLGPDADREHGRVERMMRGLFDHYLEHPEEVPRWDPAAERAASASTDYIAGMTDRYCIAQFTELTIPEGVAVLDGADLGREPGAGQADAPTSSR